MNKIFDFLESVFSLFELAFIILFAIITLPFYKKTLKEIAHDIKK